MHGSAASQKKVIGEQLTASQIRTHITKDHVPDEALETGKA